MAQSLFRHVGSWTRFLLPLLGLAAVLAAAGCHPAVTDPKDPKFIVAEKKGEWQITRSELDTQVDTYLAQHQLSPAQVGPSKMPALESAMLDNMVLKKLVLARAAQLPLTDGKEEAAMFAQLKGGFPSDVEFQAKLKESGMTEEELKQRVHDEVQIKRVFEADAFKNVDPSEEEVDAFYLAHKDKFVIPTSVRASRILIMVNDQMTPAQKAGAKKAIDQARARVVKGEDFSKVALDVSEDAYSKPRGGDIGVFQKGMNEPEFDDVAFNTKPGVLSPVFLTPMGYQFLKVTEVQPGGPVSVADARANIVNYLKQQKMGDQEAAYTKHLLSDGGVTFHLARVELPDAGATNAAAGQAPDGSAPAPEGAASAPPASTAPAQ